jgi:hypothetical protein
MVGNLEKLGARRRRRETKKTRKGGLPKLGLIIPYTILNLVARLDEAVGAEPLSHVLKIGADLAAGGVQVGPVGVGGKRVLV